MENKQNRVARYKVWHTPEGNRFRFFCDVSGALVCTTEPVMLDTPEQELQFAWENEGKRHFNMCHKCGKWVSDVAYNAETFECVECSPWEEEPSYCPHCGGRVIENETFCRKCKNRLRYGNDVENNDDTRDKTDYGMSVGGVKDKTLI